jgi:hypothetical protein
MRTAFARLFAHVMDFVVLDVGQPVTPPPLPVPLTTAPIRKSVCVRRRRAKTMGDVFMLSLLW